MEGDRSSYEIDGHSVIVQRYLPVGFAFGLSYRLLLIFDASISIIKLSEHDVRTYFDTHFGQSKAFAWTSENVACIDFDE